MLTIPRNDVGICNALFFGPEIVKPNMKSVSRTPGVTHKISSADLTV